MVTKRALEDATSRFLGAPASFTISDDLSRGDLTTPVALSLAKHRNTSPEVLAKHIVQELRNQFPTTHIEVAAPGFVNVWLSAQDLIEQIHPQEALLAKSGLSQTIVIEYSQPNIAKPMHFGHLRTTILGESLKRLLRAAGATVIAVNHLGDWGSQFGKLIAAYKLWGSPETLRAGGIREMLRLYVKFHEEAKEKPELAEIGAAEFLKLERGDTENRQLWRQMRDVSLIEFRAFYQRMGIEMDELEMGESDYESMLAPLISQAIQTGVAIESDGALIVPVGTDLPPMILRKSDGATIYATRDIAQIKYRIERWHPDRMLYVVAADQALHFRQVFRAAEKFGFGGQTQLIHIPFGLVNQPDGKKMSTRAGRVIFLEDVLNEAAARAAALLKEKSPSLEQAALAELAEQIGVGAVKYQVLNQNRNSTITFNWDHMLSLQGNTGPYLQYTVARASSVLAKAESISTLPTAGYTAKEHQLLRLLVQFPEIVLRAADDYAPNHLTDWLFRLAGEFNSFYEKWPILQAPPANRQRRLALTQAARDTLVRGLDLLTIAAPERL